MRVVIVAASVVALGVGAALLVGCSSSSSTGDDPSAEPSSGKQPSVTAPYSATDRLLRDFLAARVAGKGAQRYLSFPERAIPLLYATSSGALYKRAEFNRIRGIEWPYGYTAFRVRLFARGTVVEQLFFKPPDGPRGLVYEPDGFATAIGPTTENGRPVAMPYTWATGEVTVQVPHPWVSWSTPDTFYGRLGGLRLIPQSAGAWPTTDAGERNHWDDLVLMADPTLYGTCWRRGARPGDAEALANAVRSEPGVQATAPVAVGARGAEALMMDVVIAAGARVPFCPGRESGLLSSVVNPDGRGRSYRNGEAGYATGERMRLYLFDAPEGSSIRVLAIAIIAPESRVESVVEAASLIIDSVEFQAGFRTASPNVGDGEEWIAFTSVPPGITLIRADGTGSHVILGRRGGQSSPEWSPDGSEIAYMQGGRPTITDVRGRDPRPLIESIPADLEGLYWGSPAWSPDGSEVAVVGSTGYHLTRPFRSTLAIVDVATGELTRVGELATGRLFRSPRWSPAGQAIVFTADRYSCDNGCDLYGGSAVSVIRRRGDAWSAPKEITDVGRYGPADWHPTKDLILFGDRDIRGDVPGAVGTDFEPTHLYTIRSDGSERTTLASFGFAERPSGPTWTSDGRIIVTLVTVDEHVRGIALLNADGSGLEVVVPADEIGQSARPHPRMRPR